MSGSYMVKNLLNSVVLASVILLGSCSKAPTSTEAKETVKPIAPPEAVAAHNAFWEMYKPARSWSKDVLPLTLTSGDIEGIKSDGGKAGKWTAVFVSPGLRQARTFTYVVQDALPQFTKGVNMGGTQPWSGPTPQSKPFATGEFVVNSDAAYTAAMEKAAAWVKKNPNKKLSIYLAKASKYEGPLWYFLWGDTKTGFLAHIDATTGKAVSIK